MTKGDIKWIKKHTEKTETARKLLPVPAGPKAIMISFSFKALIYSTCFFDLPITDCLGVLIN